MFCQANATQEVWSRETRGLAAFNCNQTTPYGCGVKQTPGLSVWSRIDVTELPQLDPIFHQPVRTRLVVLPNIEPQSFSQLKSQLGTTDGNLDAHLRKLAAAGYLHSRMITAPRPATLYHLSPSGKRAFRTYLHNLEEVTNLVQRSR